MSARTIIKRFQAKKPRSSDAGITLIEVLAAMIVLALGVLGLAPMMVISVTGTEFADDATGAVVAAERQLELMGAPDSFAVLPFTVVDTLAGGKYTMTTVVEDEATNASVPAGTYGIDVTIAWVDDNGLNRQFGFTTYKAKP